MSCVPANDICRPTLKCVAMVSKRVSPDPRVRKLRASSDSELQLNSSIQHSTISRCLLSRFFACIWILFSKKVKVFAESSRARYRVRPRLSDVERDQRKKFGKRRSCLKGQSGLCVLTGRLQGLRWRRNAGAAFERSPYVCGSYSSFPFLPV